MLLSSNYIQSSRKKHSKPAPTLEFHDRMPKQNLKTLADMNKNRNIVRVSGKEMIHNADKDMLGNTLMIVQGRKLYMEKVLAYPLGPIPWTLAILDCSLRKATV